MDRNKRNSGVIKIFIAILLWSLFPLYKATFSLTDSSIDDPVIGILRFLAFLGGFCFLIYGILQIGKSRNLQNKPSLDSSVLERKSRSGTYQIFISLLVAIVVFVFGMITDFERSASLLSFIWMICIIVSMNGLVSLKKNGPQKTIYLLFLMLTYSGMLMWGFLYSFRNWSW